MYYFFIITINSILDLVLNYLTKGCCWTFAPTGAITTIYAIKRGGKIILMPKLLLIDYMFEHYRMSNVESKLEKNKCFELSRRMTFKFVEEHDLVEVEYAKK
ncbi:hypothetical protein AABB24_028037 [Solanum stoloniferum]|uniref:Uncharacterized protein n=1 Tax=Solanum stoloniferum TaxID=62892 RepID=A0ABD2S5L4_9SOLN